MRYGAVPCVTAWCFLVAQDTNLSATNQSILGFALPVCLGECQLPAPGSYLQCVRFSNFARDTVRRSRLNPKARRAQCLPEGPQKRRRGTVHNLEIC